MKIPNPWPNHSHTVCLGETEDNVELVAICPAGPELTVPDGIVKAVLIPVRNGRSDAPATGNPMVWTEALGIVTPEEYEASFDEPMPEMAPPEPEPEDEPEPEPDEDWYDDEPEADEED